MSTCLIVRPGETDYDLEERIQGTLDLPLNEQGHREVDSIIERLQSQPVEVVFASPCEPARSTAETISEALDVPLRELDELTNLHHGLWQGLSVDDIRRKQPRVFKQWRESPESVCPPEGESCEEASNRILKALKRPLKKRECFVVVASEPLATLISCTLRGGDLQLPACRPDKARNLVELIDTQGRDEMLLVSERRPAKQNGSKVAGSSEVKATAPTSRAVTKGSESAGGQ